MDTIFRHWTLFRRLAIGLAVLSTLAAALITFLPYDDWLSGIILIFFSAMFVVMPYSWPFIMRGVAEISAPLFRSKNRRSTWMQTALWWFSIIGMLWHVISFALLPEGSHTDEGIDFALGLCALLGLFLGSGDFLVRERKMTAQSDG